MGELLLSFSIMRGIRYFPPRWIMYRDKKVVVVMPAYNAARTLRQTHAEVHEQQMVDGIILVDDGSWDDTVPIARSLEGVQVHVHAMNKGYGGNQKTCFRLALEAGADLVIMIHPDYQYTPKLIPAMVSIIAAGLYPCVLGSRILHDRLRSFVCGAARFGLRAAHGESAWLNVNHVRHRRYRSRNLVKALRKARGFLLGEPERASLPNYIREQTPMNQVNRNRDGIGLAGAGGKGKLECIAGHRLSLEPDAVAASPSGQDRREQREPQRRRQHGPTAPNFG